MLIAGDIGGTKTLLAFYTAEHGPREPEVVREFPSERFAGLGDVVRAFLEEVKQPATAACFDVAGPVRDGRAQLTNLPWLVDEQALAEELGLAQVSVINDLKAIAYAIPHLHDEDVRAINPGKAEPHGPIAVIAPGTGLGEAFLIWDGSRYIACASEGGHADFGPADPLQAALWAHLFEKFGHVSYERMCSGSAIPGIYDFFRAREPAAESAAFAATLAAVHDRTPPIVKAALEGGRRTGSLRRRSIFSSPSSAPRRATSRSRCWRRAGSFLPGGCRRGSCRGSSSGAPAGGSCRLSPPSGDSRNCSGPSRSTWSWRGRRCWARRSTASTCCGGRGRSRAERCGDRALP